MIVRPRLLKLCQLPQYIRGSLIAQHFRAQHRICALHRNIERREMIALYARKIRRPHIRQRHKVAIEKGEAIVIILDGEAVAHIRRNHVDKAEITVIGAGANPVEDRTFKLHAEFLIVILVECNQLLLSIRMLHEELDLLVRHCKAEINDVAQRHIVNREDFIPRDKLQFLCNAPLQHAQDDARIRSRHIPLLSHEKGVTFHHSSVIVWNYLYLNLLQPVEMCLDLTFCIFAGLSPFRLMLVHILLDVCLIRIALRLGD